MTQDDGPRVLVVEELVHENVQGSTQRVECVVANILRKNEGRESDRHSKMRKVGLDEVSVRTSSAQRLDPHLTSINMPGMKIRTASPWKNFLRAFKLRCVALRNAAVCVSGFFSTPPAEWEPSRTSCNWIPVATPDVGTVCMAVLGCLNFLERPTTCCQPVTDPDTSKSQ